jgi:UDP-N-acetylmuramate--alanine ligase
VDTVPENLAQILENDDLVLVQGAGNVGKVARKLAEQKFQPVRKGEEQHG